MSDDKCRAYQPTGSETLEKLVMDPNIPKSETEGWACREIERLRARVEVLRKELTDIAEYCDELDATVSTISYAARRALARTAEEATP